MIFGIFIKLIWLGVGFLNITGAEVGYQLDKKNAKISFFNVEKMQKYHFLLLKKKNQKYRKCPALIRFSFERDSRIIAEMSTPNF